jgi:hypothetical protein
LVIDDFVETVSDEEIAKSGNECGLESFIKLPHSSTSGVHLLNDMPGIVAESPC